MNFNFCGHITIGTGAGSEHARGRVSSLIKTGSAVDAAVLVNLASPSYHVFGHSLSAPLCTTTNPPIGPPARLAVCRMIGGTETRPREMSLDGTNSTNDSGKLVARLYNQRVYRSPSSKSRPKTHTKRPKLFESDTPVPAPRKNRGAVQGTGVPSSPEDSHRKGTGGNPQRFSRRRRASRTREEESTAMSPHGALEGRRAKSAAQTAGESGGGSNHSQASLWSKLLMQMANAWRAHIG